MDQTRVIEVKKNILAANDEAADAFRAARAAAAFAQAARAGQCGSPAAQRLPVDRTPDFRNKISHIREHNTQIAKMQIRNHDRAGKRIGKRIGGE